jgi:hypothetical protein
MRFTLKMGERAVDRIVRLAHLARHPRLASYVTWGHFIVDGPLNNYHEFLAIAGLAAAIFPNIRTLIMYGRALRMSGTLLLMFPAAKTIDLFDFWYDEYFAMELPTRLGLESITLKFNRLHQLNMVLQALRGTGSFMSLTYLSVGFDSDDRILWKQLFRHLQASPNLRRLKISLTGTLMDVIVADSCT